MDNKGAPISMHAWMVLDRPGTREPRRDCISQREMNVIYMSYLG